MKVVDGSGLNFSSQDLLKGFEGGAAYTAELAGTFYRILDEGTMADLLSEEDQAGMTFVKHLEFETAADRDEYIVARGWGS
tara:strand:- start:4461 stop:4703 length:243 start_codon:yes stop_codon:yes gene_type:complete